MHITYNRLYPDQECRHQARHTLAAGRAAGAYPETVSINLWGLDAIKTKVSGGLLLCKLPWPLAPGCRDSAACSNLAMLFVYCAMPKPAPSQQHQGPATWSFQG